MICFSHFFKRTLFVILIALCDTLLDQKTALCLIRDGAEVLAIIAQLSIFALSLIDSIWQTVTQNHISDFPKFAYDPCVKLRISPKQNSALLSAFLACVCTPAGHSTFLQYILYIGINAM